MSGLGEWLSDHSSKLGDESGEEENLPAVESSELFSGGGEGTTLRPSIVIDNLSDFATRGASTPERAQAWVSALTRLVRDRNVVLVAVVYDDGELSPGERAYLQASDVVLEMTTDLKSPLVSIPKARHSSPVPGVFELSSVKDTLTVDTTESV